MSSIETKSSWPKILRLLLWWLAFVAALLLYHLHQKWSERTHVSFTVSLDGNGSFHGAQAMCDRKFITSGQRVSIGRHRFSVQSLKTDGFFTNLFVWYGENDLGNIDLKRSKGVLNVQAAPPAHVITITGPEFSTTLHDSPGESFTVPTDQYTVQAEYAHWSQTQNPVVISGGNTPCAFTPQLGALYLTCERTNATYQLQDGNGQFIGSGVLPALATGLPVAAYQLTADCQGHEVKNSVSVKFGATNGVPVEFPAGTVRLESVPDSAVVYATDDGSYVGMTPLSLTNLLPATVRFKLQSPGYEDAIVEGNVVANQTIVVSTNMIRLAYRINMKQAETSMLLHAFDQAFAAVALALAAKPGDVDALNLQQEIKFRQLLQQARDIANQADYPGAENKLAAALEMRPDSDEAKSLLHDIKSLENQQADRLKQEQQARAARPQQIFDSVLGTITDSSLFKAHVLTTGKSAADVQSAVVSALKAANPPFAVNVQSVPGAYQIYIKLDFQNGGGERARRAGVVIVGQTKDDETQVLFKVLEYVVRSNPDGSGTLIPLDASRIQMDNAMDVQLFNGAYTVTDIIKKAIGQ
jgi:hypothetical protein